MRKNTPLTIYIDRLKDDDTEQILEVVDSALFSIDENELSLLENVTISGQAYLAKSHLILELKIKAKISMPCSICNQKIEAPVQVDDFAHHLEICEVKSGVWDYSEEIRSALLLKVPQFIECNEGRCKERSSIKKYMAAPEKEEVRTPFSDLDLLP